MRREILVAQPCGERPMLAILIQQFRTPLRSLRQTKPEHAHNNANLGKDQDVPITSAHDWLVKRCNIGSTYWTRGSDLCVRLSFFLGKSVVRLVHDLTWFIEERLEVGANEIQGHDRLGMISSPQQKCSLRPAP